MDTNNVCAVTCCSNTSTTKGIRFFKFPKDIARCKQWCVASRQSTTFENRTVIMFDPSYRICSRHFDDSMYVGKVKKRLLTDAVPTLYLRGNTDDVDRSNEARVQTTAGETVNREKRRCRTCLEVMDARYCIEITKICYLQKTIKEAITILVPEMASTLSAEDVVCRTCYKVLKSSLKFIERCLEVELKIAEENKRLEEYDRLEEPFLDLPSEQANKSVKDLIELVYLDHDYCGKATVESVPVPVSLKITSKDSENSQDHDGSLICNSLPPFEVDKDKRSDNIPESNILRDLLQECKMLDDNLDSVVVREEEVKVTCQICCEKFSSDDFKLHAEIHPPHICGHCGKGFSNQASYSTHLKIHVDSYRMLCDVCGKLVKFETGLKRHKFCHTKDRPYMCHKCPKSYKTNPALNRHENLVHRKLGQQQCHECGKIFRTMGMCRTHYRLKHLKLKPFACNICKREFGRKDYLQNHMRWHTAEPVDPSTGSAQLAPASRRRGRMNKFGFRCKNPGKPVTCKICGKEITSLGGLKLHLLNHAKIKRFKCRYCDLPFVTAKHRERHEKTHEANSEHKFRCNICWKWMKTEQELDVHVSGHSKRSPRHECETCGEKFHRRYLLDNHRLDKHLNSDDVNKAEREIIELNLMEYAVNL